MVARYGSPNIQGDDFRQTFQLQRQLMKARQPSDQAAMARALMQQGASTAPVSSPVEGLARALMGGLGGYFAGQEARAQDESENQMLLGMQGQAEQRRADESAQLAQAGVPGFKMPMPQPVPGQAYAQPVAPAGGGAEIVPPDMLAPAAQPAARPVNAELIAALAQMGAAGNRTAAGALPGFQFQYQDAEAKAREARDEARANAREARMNQESFGQPQEYEQNGQRVLVQIGNRGTIRPVQGGFQVPQPPPAAPPPPFAGTSIEAQDRNILDDPNADPSSRRYWMAYNNLYGPQRREMADGTVVTFIPTPPPTIRPPVLPPGMQGGGNPPPAPGVSPPPAAAGAPPSTTTPVPGGVITRTGGDTQRLPTAELKLKEETETQIQGLQATRALLDQAMSLSRDAYAGFGAAQRGAVAGQTGFDTRTAEATRRFQAIMGTQALERLKEIFGGNPTEGERKILLDLQASANMSRAEREALIRDAQQAVARREPFLRQRLEEITAGRYGRVGVPSPLAQPSVPAPPPGFRIDQ